MANDPAFIFYPGDYLRDTQCLSEKTQVAYDRIMCEHMRNICISKKQLKFFTKRLDIDEQEELKMVLTEINGGYEITWVAESIVKRRKYSESRRKNRTGTIKETNNISKTYVTHMEIENEIIIRKKKFINEVLLVNSNDIILDDTDVYNSNGSSFIEYWSEHGPNDRKMRFEKEKSFDINLRLLKWKNNKSKFSAQSGKEPMSSYAKKYPEQFNEDGTAK